MESLFEEQVAQVPDNVAITFEGTQISYGQLNARSNQIANALLKLNLKLNQPVAILLETGPHQIEAMLGVLKAGCVYICLDPNYRPPLTQRDARSGSASGVGQCGPRHAN